MSCTKVNLANIPLSCPSPFHVLLIVSYFITQYMPVLAARRSSGAQLHQISRGPFGASGHLWMCFHTLQGVLFRAMQVLQYLHCSYNLEQGMICGRYPQQRLHWLSLGGIYNKNNPVMRFCQNLCTTLVSRTQLYSQYFGFSHSHQFSFP